MKLETINETVNPLFKRKEVVVEIQSEVAPKNEDVKKEIADKFSISEDSVRINKIAGRFGVQKFTVTANLYESKEALDNYEIKTKKQREAEKKAKAKEVEEAAKAKAEAEKPKEEPKEEVPAEKPVETEAPKEETKSEEKTE